MMSFKVPIEVSSLIEAAGLMEDVVSTSGAKVRCVDAT